MGKSSQPIQNDEFTLEEGKVKVKPPRLYKVILLNDDYTPMEFVVTVLEQFFSMHHELAVQVMLQVHTQGRGTCGVFSREIAETKIFQVNEYSRQYQYPLQCTMELDREVE
ncbi:specificity factor for ClpA-ClpP chaperone-protease complex [Gammaproteobacteria bacterium]